MRAGLLLPLALWATVWTTSPELGAQKTEPPLPVANAEAAHSVLVRLYLYYHLSLEDHLAPRAGRVCNADRGDQCFEGDHESYCTLIWCHTEEEQAEFVEDLAELAREHPESPYAVGHAVYAAVRLEEYDVGRELVEACAPLDRWWCHLVRGYFLHRTARLAEAAEHLRRGLEAAPQDLRCRLEDVAWLLPDGARERYEEIPCGERADVHRLVWWLADPFHIDAANDRWAEHVARRIALLLHEHRMQATAVEAGLATVHPAIHEEQVVRRGFWDSWNFARVTGLRRGRTERFGYTGRLAAANHFVPDRLSLETWDRRRGGRGGLAVGDSVRWRIEAERDDEGYTRSGGIVVEAPTQVARFLDGDSLVVALASDLAEAGLVDSSPATEDRSGDEAAAREGIVLRQGSLREIVGAGRAHFVASEGPGQSVSLEPGPVRERVVFAATLANRSQLGGLEVFSPAGTARHRRVLRSLETEEPALSDLLLFRPLGVELPEDRSRAIALMHGSTRVPKDRELGVYWEAYGLPVDGMLRVSVTLEGEEGWVARLGRAVGVVGERTGQTISWTEETGGARPFTQAFTLDLEGLDEGEITLTFRVELADGRVLSRTRMLEVVEEEAG